MNDNKQRIVELEITATFTGHWKHINDNNILVFLIKKDEKNTKNYRNRADINFCRGRIMDFYQHARPPLRL